MKRFLCRFSDGFVLFAIFVMIGILMSLMLNDFFELVLQSSLR